MNGLKSTSKEKKESSRILLSIGSNEEDRLKHLSNAISLIEKEVGVVIKKSRIYESDSWGFDSNSFYNQSLLVLTELNMFDCLNLLKQIELRLGRTEKTTNLSYSNRPIDIDIIFNDQTVIQTDELTIPHYLFHKRSFVLIPTKEILPEFLPPGFSQNISQLVDSCEDKGKCLPIEQ